MFLFFHLSYSDMVGVTFLYGKNDTATVMTVIVIAICMIVIFFANDFYVKKKSKDIAVRMVCGGTYFQIARYLLYQTGLLFICAIPIGVFAAYSLFPFINMLLSSYFHSSQGITLQISSIFSTIIIIGFEIFWCIILNLGYAYRHSIKSLLEQQENSSRWTFPKFFNASPQFKKRLNLILFIGPVILFYLNYQTTDSFLPLSAVGCFGLLGTIRHAFIPFLNHKLIHHYIEDRFQFIYFGLLRSDIILMKNNIVLLIGSIVLLISILVSSLDNPVELMLSVLSFVVINILMSLSIMFRFSTEIVGRQKVFSSLGRIGYMKNDQKQIIRYEVIGLYLFLICVSLIYIGNIFVILIINHFVDFMIILGLFVAFLVPMVLCCLFNIIYYQKVIFEEETHV